jgi:hypothetical protein
MQVSLAVIADYANVSTTGKLNIMGIFDRIVAASVPVQHPSMQLVIALESDPTERGTTKNVEIRLIDADGAELVHIGGPLPVPANADLVQRFNQVIQLAGLIFPRYGDYSFRISVNGEQKAAVSFTVARPPAQPAPPSPSA